MVAKSEILESDEFAVAAFIVESPSELEGREDRGFDLAGLLAGPVKGTAVKVESGDLVAGDVVGGVIHDSAECTWLLAKSK